MCSWEPKNFNLEKTSVWSFPIHGDWATHDSKWRGNWSPYIPRNLILRYTKEGEIILDQFAGGGTTLVEAKLLKRNIIGVDINDLALETCSKKIDFSWDTPFEPIIRKGDACNLNFIKTNSIDFICTHPPYADIIKYSKHLEGDISCFDRSVFLKKMEKVASESYRVLKKNKKCAILIGDIRKKGLVQPLGFEVMNIFIEKGFELKEIILKEQHNCKSTGEWENISVSNNFLLLAHEYLFVFEK